MSFSALLDELRQEYITELPEKITHIAEHFDTQAFQTVCEDFHKLKGTGKTYGIPEISELAEVVERICLDRPEAIASAVPEALTLLTEIHRVRTTAQPFDIGADQRFSRLKRLAS